MDVVLLLIMAAAGKAERCPSHAERQYHFVYEAKTMSEAQRYCREKHTDLATVDSMEVVKLLNNMAGQYNQSAWIGLHDDRDTWKWSMSDPSFYGPGEIEVVCFDVTGPSATFVLTDSKMTWTEAQSYCREHHTDLTRRYEALIGLYRDSWKWSDGSNSSFKNHSFATDLWPVSMQVIKVRVEKPNGVDLNDKAFLDEMLVEAKKNLRAQGLDDNVQLAWRKQPDGQ
ncbi:P-selectin, partial [Dissostichus eleginoides]